MSGTVHERLSRDVRRRLLKEDERWVGKPLDLEPSRRGAEAHARHLALMLLDTGLKHRATTAVKYAATVLDTALSQQMSSAVACRKGCHHCCKSLVTATIPEILRMANAVRAKEQKQQRLTETAQRSKTIPQADREVNRLTCAILEDQTCSEYPDRPLLCRAAYSSSLDKCIRIFETNSGEAFPYIETTLELRRRMVAILQAALMIAGLPHFYYELNQGVTAALPYPDAEERWLAGEPLFAAVDINIYEKQNTALNMSVRRLAEAVKATL